MSNFSPLNQSQLSDLEKFNRSSEENYEEGLVANEKAVVLEKKIDNIVYTLKTVWEGHEYVKVDQGVLKAVDKEEASNLRDVNAFFQGFINENKENLTLDQTSKVNEAYSKIAGKIVDQYKPPKLSLFQKIFFSLIGSKFIVKDREIVEGKTFNIQNQFQNSFQRKADHINRFNQILESCKKSGMDPSYVEKLEAKLSNFSEKDLTAFHENFVKTEKINIFGIDKEGNKKVVNTRIIYECRVDEKKNAMQLANWLLDKKPDSETVDLMVKMMNFRDNLPKKDISSQRATLDRLISQLLEANSAQGLKNAIIQAMTKAPKVERVVESRKQSVGFDVPTQNSKVKEPKNKKDSYNFVVSNPNRDNLIWSNMEKGSGFLANSSNKPTINQTRKVVLNDLSGQLKGHVGSVSLSNVLDKIPNDQKTEQKLTTTKYVVAEVNREILKTALINNKDELGKVQIQYFESKLIGSLDSNGKIDEKSVLQKIPLESRELLKPIVNSWVNKLNEEMSRSSHCHSIVKELLVENEAHIAFDRTSLALQSNKLFKEGDLLRTLLVKIPNDKQGPILDSDFKLDDIPENQREGMKAIIEYLNKRIEESSDKNCHTHMNAMKNEVHDIDSSCYPSPNEPFYGNFVTPKKRTILTAQDLTLITDEIRQTISDVLKANPETNREDQISKVKETVTTKINQIISNSKAKVDTVNESIKDYEKITDELQKDLSRVFENLALKKIETVNKEDIHEVHQKALSASKEKFLDEIKNSLTSLENNSDKEELTSLLSKNGENVVEQVSEFISKKLENDKNNTNWMELNHKVEKLNEYEAIVNGLINKLINPDDRYIENKLRELAENIKKPDSKEVYLKNIKSNLFTNAFDSAKVDAMLVEINFPEKAANLTSKLLELWENNYTNRAANVEVFTRVEAKPKSAPD